MVLPGAVARDFSGQLGSEVSEAPHSLPKSSRSKTSDSYPSKRNATEPANVDKLCASVISKTREVQFSLDVVPDGKLRKSDDLPSASPLLVRWRQKVRIVGVLGLYVVWMLFVAVACVVRSLQREQSGWPPLGRLLPLIILAMPGSWAIAVPMMSLKAHEPMGIVLSAAAVLPPAWTGQLLFRTAAGAEFGQICQADFYALLAGVFQFALLSAVSAWRMPTAKFPLPLVLGAVQGMGHLVAVLLVPLIMETRMQDAMVVESLLLPIFAFLLVGASAQLTWGVRFQLDEDSSTLAALRRLQQVNWKHRGQEGDSSRTGTGPMVGVLNHYEETIHQVEAVLDAISKRPKMSKEVVSEFGVALHKIKGTLTSGKLFKTEVMAPRFELDPPNPGICPVMPSLSDSSLREQLRQVRSMVDNEPVEHIKPRLSTGSEHMDQSESLIVDDLPGNLSDGPKKPVKSNNRLAGTRTGVARGLGRARAPPAPTARVARCASTISSASWRSSIEVVSTTTMRKTTRCQSR